MIEGLLSIVIPCKNEEKQIGHTLAALQNQTVDMSRCTDLYCRCRFN